MQLTSFTDYSLRLLLYLGAHEGELSQLSDISQAYGISQNHLVKVVGRLTQLGLVESVRGRGGGVRLACEASAINLGEVVRKTEPHFHLVECFQAQTTTRCPIEPVCGLKGILREAQSAFFAVLERYTLSDLLKDPASMRALLQ
ncbi:MAG: Rrf2 family transcriptional regulator [Myxococcales bacterium]|nr:Rrf2 family transcriptional regulator [Myxococcales bacterium]